MQSQFINYLLQTKKLDASWDTEGAGMIDISFNFSFSFILSFGFRFSFMLALSFNIS